MKVLGSVVAISLIILAVGINVSFAVGYEPVKPLRPSVTDTAAWARGDMDAWNALAEASFVEHYPKVIDGAALSLKALLGQFGLTGSRYRAHR